MLFLLFKLGEHRYALEAGRIVEVVPLLTLRRLPKAPKGLVGIFNYRGRPVPAVDLCELTVGQPARERLSTRIIIVNYHDERGANHLLGLVAEQATEMLRKEAGEFVDAGISVGAVPYLGPILLDAKGAIQLINEQRLLSAPVRQLLFSEAGTVSHDGN